MRRGWRWATGVVVSRSGPAAETIRHNDTQGESKNIWRGADGWGVNLEECEAAQVADRSTTMTYIKVQLVIPCPEPEHRDIPNYIPIGTRKWTGRY